MDKVRFHISGAGIAGDPQKLLVGVSDDRRINRLFNSNWLICMRYAKYKILKELEILTGRKHVEK